MKKTIKLLRPVIVGLVGALCYGGAVFAQPTINNIYPNGTNLFQPSTVLTFSASSGMGVPNITVDPADAIWTPLAGALSGNNTVRSAGDPVATSGHRFYRAQVQ